ncbi:MAG: DUF4384 domain-containing protein, partial [Candidatus Melainabacteria bacterium]|nr:DUF4384 domain-containing protein [Candidatus Melainabacteria bacterium]
MRAAIRNLALTQALTVAIMSTIGCGFALAGNGTNEPTAEDLKNSKERGIMLLPRTSTINTIKPETKRVPPASHAVRQSQPARAARKQRSSAPQAKASSLRVPPESKLGEVNSAVAQPSGSLTSSESIINVWLDKKGSAPLYKHGDKIKINVSASQDCNVMIFDYDGRGKLTQLYPNEYQQKTLLRAGDTITFGGADSPFDYQVSLPKGSSRVQERIFVYAYPLSEKPLSIALNSEDGSPFRSGEMTLAQYKKLVAESKVFFNEGAGMGHTAGERDVKIVPKAGTNAPSLKLVSTDENKVNGSGTANKKEVSFT